MKVTLPGFVRKPLLAVWGKKWYIAGAIGLVLFGILAAFLTQDSGTSSSKATPKVGSKAVSERRIGTEAVAGAETTNQDEGDQNDPDNKPAATPAAATTPAAPSPAQQTPAATPSGPTYNNSCFNQPPAGFGLSDTPALTITAGETSGALDVQTLDDSKVIWTATAPASDSGVVLFVTHSASGYTGSNFTYEIKTTEATTPGTYAVSWRVEDGTRTICQTQTLSITVEAKP